MVVDSETIIEVGKVIGALSCILGVPLGVYKIAKNWNTKLFSKIEQLEHNIQELRNELNELKIENDKRFNEITENIHDMRGTSRTFYSVFNTMIGVMYKHHPSDELAEVKKNITEEIINKATRED